MKTKTCRWKLAIKMSTFNLNICGSCLGPRTNISAPRRNVPLNTLANPTKTVLSSSLSSVLIVSSFLLNPSSMGRPFSGIEKHRQFPHEISQNSGHYFDYYYYFCNDSFFL